MKKPRLQLLLPITLVFTALVLGFFAGRNFNRSPVLIRTLPAPTTAAASAPSAPTQSEETLGILDLNTATAQQLQTLPGIGAVLAQRIIDYRSAHGPFQTVGDLVNVSGIGEKKLEAIWDYVTIGGTS